MRSGTGFAGSVLALLVILAALLAPPISPYDPLEQDILARLSGPSAEYPLGADNFRRDRLWRKGFAAALIFVGVYLLSLRN